jgi:hypothetical protein
MLIQQEDDGTKGAFFIKEEDERLAEMTYKWSGEKVFIIDHTEVSEKLAGKGVGKQLVKAAVEFARLGNYKIIAVCSFARNVFDEVKAYQDVLHG